MGLTPQDAVERVRRLAERLGRTPTVDELRPIGLHTHRREVLIQAGLEPRPQGGFRDRSVTPEPVIPAVVQDAVGQRVARGRLALYRVPVRDNDTLNPLDGWMS